MTVYCFFLRGANPKAQHNAPSVVVGNLGLVGIEVSTVAGAGSRGSWHRLYLPRRQTRRLARRVPLPAASPAKPRSSSRRLPVGATGADGGAPAFPSKGFAKPWHLVPRKAGCGSVQTGPLAADCDKSRWWPFSLPASSANGKTFAETPGSVSAPHRRPLPPELPIETCWSS